MSHEVYYTSIVFFREITVDRLMVGISQEAIQETRAKHWDNYFIRLSEWAGANDILLPDVAPSATNNAHMFYLVCNSLEQRSIIIEKLKANGILSVFHYISLHESPFYKERHDGRELPNTKRYTDTLLRLPMYFELDTNIVIDNLISN